MWHVQKLRAVHDVRQPTTNMIGVRDRENGYKEFAVFDTHQAFVDHIASQKQRHFYEHLGTVPYQPLAPYADVDLKLPASTTDGECQRIINAYKSAITDLFKGLVDVPFDILVSTAIGMREGKRLLSFHIKIHGMDVFFRGMCRQCQFWTARAPWLAQRLSTVVPQQTGDVIDLSVYTERPWRVLGCSKITDPTRRLTAEGSTADWDAQSTLAHMVSLPMRSGKDPHSLGMRSFPRASIRAKFTPTMIEVTLRRAIEETWVVCREEDGLVGPYPPDMHHAVLPDAAAKQPTAWIDHLCSDLDAECYERERVRRWRVVQSLPDCRMCDRATWTRNAQCTHRLIDSGLTLYFSNMTVDFADKKYSTLPLEYLYGETHPLQIVVANGDVSALLDRIDQYISADRYHDVHSCIWIEQAPDQTKYRYTFPNLLMDQSSCDGLQDTLESMDAVVLKDASLVYFGAVNVMLAGEKPRLPAPTDPLPQILTKKRKWSGRVQKWAVAITEPFRSLLIPHRILHACSTQRVATHFWPPNGPAYYFRVPPPMWPAIECAILEAHSAGAIPLLSYCYMDRPHALQLDIDGCPHALADVARVCQTALRSVTQTADVSYALEQSPDKQGKAGFSYGRMTFPVLVVDETGSRKCKLVCAHACANAYPNTPFREWAKHIIDPASRTARTHHSGKVPTNGSTDYRVSNVRAYVCSDGTPHSGRPTEWLCPLRTDDTPVLDHACLREMNRIVSARESEVAGSFAMTTGPFNASDKVIVMRRGKRIVCSGMPALGVDATCNRIYCAIQHTAYVRAVINMGRTVDVIFVGYDRKKHTYFCRTNSKYCPWREETDYKILNELGKREGISHNDNHMWIVIQRDPPRGKGGMTLRCNAQWHTLNKTKKGKCFKERDITPADWTDVRDKLFVISGARERAKCLYDMCCN